MTRYPQTPAFFKLASVDLTEGFAMQTGTSMNRSARATAARLRSGDGQPGGAGEAADIGAAG